MGSLLHLLPLAQADGDSGFLDIVIWLVIAGFWIVRTVILKQRKPAAKKQRNAPAPSAQRGAPPRTRPELSSDELRDALKRIGVQVRQPARPPAPPAAPRRQADFQQQQARARQAEFDAARKHQQKQEAADIAAEEEAARARAKKHGWVLPRMVGIGMDFAPWPSVPMPPFNPTSRKNKPLPIRLHTRKHLREAIIARILLEPPQSTTNTFGNEPPSV